MARTTMMALIDRLRKLINDPAGTDEVFTDDDLQGFLDGGRVDVFGELLSSVPELVNGTTLYRAHLSQQGMWESDVALVDGSGVTLTPTTSDCMVGRWDFTAGQAPPVRVTGKYYDLNDAAATALEAWAAREALAYDFSADGASYRRSQKAENLRALAATFRKSGRVGYARLVV